jgi:hypothetical protein
MADPKQPLIPLAGSEVVERYFLEHRAKLLDIAAFLDRVGRAEGSQDDDFRLRSLRHAITLLIDGKPERTRRILELFSDRTEEPIDKAPMKGATGAWEDFAGH